jgi:hypothetical protein
MDMNPVFFRVNDDTVINIAQVVRIEHQKKVEGTESARILTADQGSYLLEGERLKAFLRLAGKIR